MRGFAHRSSNAQPPVIVWVNDPFDISSAPRLVPLNYPGARPRSSCLITANSLIELTAPQSWDGDAGLLETASSSARNRTLDQKLAQLGHAPISDRVPVIAIGSNCSPAQLRHKFVDSPEQLCIPSLRATLHGASIGFCSFVTSLGYIPATLYPDAKATAEVTVQYLDAQQLAGLDATEGTVYRRVWLDSILIEMCLGSDIVHLAGAYAYVAENGYLGEGCRGYTMGFPGESTPGRCSGWHMRTQTELIDHLLRFPEFLEACGPTVDQVTSATAGFDLSHRALMNAGVVITHNQFAEFPDERDLPFRHRIAQ